MQEVKFIPTADASIQYTLSILIKCLSQVIVRWNMICLCWGLTAQEKESWTSEMESCRVRLYYDFIYEPGHDKTYDKICVTSKESDHSVHPPSMARVPVYPSLDSLEVFFWLCWGLTTRQPLRVILCRLPEKGRKEIGESRGDEREGQGRKRNRNESEETEEIKTFPLYPYPLQG